MKNSLKALLLVLASGSLLMTSCGDNEVYPNLNQDKIEIKDNSNTFTDETLDILYEKIHDSSTTGSEVRDVIIDAVAKQTLGEFKIENNKIILKDYDGKTKDEKIAFVKAHKAYWDKKEVDGKFEPGDEPTDLTPAIENRVEVIKNLVFTNVVSKMFDEANSDLYKEHNIFKEYKFARDKFKTSKVGDFSYEGDKNIYDKKYEAEDSDVFSNNKLIDSTVTKEDPKTIVGEKPMLHLDYYQDYINSQILPSIIDTLLVEQYIFDNQYTTLSRTQARKINYVAIQATDKTNLSAKQLVNKFIDKYITNEDGSITKDTKINFEILANAWKGLIEDDSAAQSLLDESKAFTKVTNHNEALEYKQVDPLHPVETKYIDGTTDKTFYRETEYGQLMLDYAKINTNVHDSISNTKQKEFSNSGAYTVEKGLEYKTRDIKVKDYTTNAWGTKDSGFSSLPTSIKDTLFEYSVSIDTPVNKSEESFKESSYVELINGHYYLKAQNAKSENYYDTIAHYDESSKTFYIVEIEEALSQSKLSYNTTVEDGGYEPAKREEIAREIGYTMASGETYKNTAYLHYLENCDITYHDQSIYDFMKETYPDLFEENK